MDEERHEQLCRFTNPPRLTLLLKEILIGSLTSFPTIEMGIYSVDTEGCCSFRGLQNHHDMSQYLLQ